MGYNLEQLCFDKVMLANALLWTHQLAKGKNKENI